MSTANDGHSDGPVTVLSPVRRAWVTVAARVPLPVRGSARILKRVASDHGYLRSAREQLPVDRHGRPVPWYTFPAVEYLDQLDLGGRRVFEFGSGNSTRWWLSKGAIVTSVESDRAWYLRMEPLLRGPDMQYHFAGDRDSYVQAIDGGGPYDVVVVDGYWRGDCARRAVDALTEGGMVILDNSDWLPELAADLRRAGLLQVDFHGFVSLVDSSSTTSILFHRQANFAPVGGVQPRPPRGGVALPAWRRRWLLDDPQATPG